MQLGLGVGLSKQRKGVIAGEIPAVGGDPPGSFDGFEIPPTVETVADTVVVRGKTKAGFIGKFVVPLGDLVADRVFNVNFVADLSGLAQGGAKSGFGFGMKNGNSFRLTLLQGDGVGVNATTVRGSPPNGWNKQTGHTTANGGAPTSGTQHEADVQLVTNAGGDAYTFSTSGDNQETWDAELEDQALTPFADVTGVEQFGIAGWFASDDAGEFSITVTWTEEAAAIPAVLLLHGEGADESTTITDSTGRHTLVSNNQAQVDTAQFKFGSASLFFASGTGSHVDYITISTSDADFDFPAGTDFTVDFWIRPSGIPVNSFVQFSLLDWRGGTGGGSLTTPWIKLREDAKLAVFSGSDYMESTNTLSVDTWHHVAFVREGQIQYLFLDGNLEDTFDDGGSNNIAAGTDGPWIGGSSGPTFGLDGWLDEIHVLKGHAAWTENFTPPSAPYDP